MSDIRFNQWLHQSGTGGVSQSDGGHVGIGTTNPLIPVGAGNTHILNVGVVTCNNISAGSSITATTFYGSGANLTSLPAQATIANNANNRLITGGSGVNLNGEDDVQIDSSGRLSVGNSQASTQYDGSNDLVIGNTTTFLPSALQPSLNSNVPRPLVSILPVFVILSLSVSLVPNLI